MHDEAVTRAFFSACESWLCDGYAMDMRYAASAGAEGNVLWGASIRLNPLPAPVDNSLNLRLPGAAFGQVQRHPLPKGELIALLRDAADGRIHHEGIDFSLPGDGALRYQSETLYPDRWHSELHLLVIKGLQEVPSPTVRTSIDTALRLAKPPFDGLTDIFRWLGLSQPTGSGLSASIAISVGLPADLVLERSALNAGVLKLTLHAHPAFDTERVRVALSVLPGVALEARRQATEMITWGQVDNDRRVGVAEIPLPQADAVLVMLMVGDTTVRRQWLLDPSRSRNSRLLAFQTFDKELKRVRSAVEVSADSHEFERGVAALLFMLGFNPAIHLETDAPDLVVSTPGGRLLVVECTTKISDFTSKLGKLVDRRGKLNKALQASGHFAQAVGVLVCQLPRDQIATETGELLAHDIILLAREQLAEGLSRISLPSDPDKLLQDALEELVAMRSRV